MNNILGVIGGLFAGLLKKLTGLAASPVRLPEGIAISNLQIDYCITVVNNIKGAVTGGLTGGPAALLNGAADDRMRKLTEDALPVILSGLTFSTNKQSAGNGEDLLSGLFEKIKTVNDADEDPLYHALAARLMVVVSEGRVSWSEAVSILEIYFKQIFNKQ
ncbi:hypothetical protein SNE26_20385 [Mucilaginibacter sp. cycad4]|uniref:hypothetical protein n=1 Tax=Mucilaginibacter sp. cycad4 TaxID=3342096 RepID=UPI002AAAEDF9|nr:hypothetical protein [Mucilaginibacter gossypii]WPU98387.1 hypothetical protein SNE26_20385 [Mucilaginibacter gossypii]